MRSVVLIYSLIHNLFTRACFSLTPLLIHDHGRLFICVLKNGRYKFLTPLDVAELNNHSDCVGFLKANGSSRGSQIVKFACRKIQRWWRINRPCKTILESIKECSHSLEETKTTNPKRFVSVCGNEPNLFVEYHSFYIFGCNISGVV